MYNHGSKWELVIFQESLCWTPHHISAVRSCIQESPTTSSQNISCVAPHTWPFLPMLCDLALLQPIIFILWLVAAQKLCKCCSSSTNIAAFNDIDPICVCQLESQFLGGSAIVFTTKPNTGIYDSSKARLRLFLLCNSPVTTLRRTNWRKLGRKIDPHFA